MFEKEIQAEIENKLRRQVYITERFRKFCTEEKITLIEAVEMALNVIHTGADQNGPVRDIIHIGAHIILEKVCPNAGTMPDGEIH